MNVIVRQVTINLPLDICWMVIYIITIIQKGDI